MAKAEIQKSETAKGATLVDEQAVRAKVAALVRQFGGTKTARLLNRPRESILAIAAGAPCHLGNLLLAERALAVLEASRPSQPPAAA